jgi:hypothetical protein
MARLWREEYPIKNPCVNLGAVCLQTAEHVLRLGIGQQTPLVATVLFTVAMIARLLLWEVFKSWPFILVVALVT